MSGDARITGHIRVQPPITWAELRDRRWALGQEGNPDACVYTASEEVDTDDGVMTRYSGPAIVPTGSETNGYTLVEDVDRIVREFATAPDGTPRTFTGWLHMDWGRGEEVCRVHVVGGRAVKSEPQVLWPAGARDVDAPEQVWP